MRTPFTRNAFLVVLAIAALILMSALAAVSRTTTEVRPAEVPKDASLPGALVICGRPLIEAVGARLHDAYLKRPAPHCGI